MLQSDQQVQGKKYKYLEKKWGGVRFVLVGVTDLKNILVLITCWLCLLG